MENRAAPRPVAVGRPKSASAAPRSASVSSPRALSLRSSPRQARAASPLRRPPYAAASIKFIAELAVLDDEGCGRVGELSAIDVEAAGREAQVEVEGPRRSERERLRAPPAGRVEQALRRSEQRLERQRFGGERARDGRPPAGVGDFDRPFKRLLGAGHRRIAERKRVRRRLDLAGDGDVVGGEDGRRRSVEESRQGGDRRDGRGHVAFGARLFPERELRRRRQISPIGESSANSNRLGAPFAAASGSLSTPAIATGAFRHSADRLKRS